MNLDKRDIEALAEAILNKSHKFKKSDYEHTLRNTGMLLKNYQLLINHIDVELPELEKEDVLHEGEKDLYSIRGYRFRTKEMMMFTKTILNRYKSICAQGTPEQRRQCDVIFSLYINDHRLSYFEIARKFNVDDSTIRRDEKKATQELSVMLFGIDSINDFSK